MALYPDDFPNLSDYEATSPFDPAYNCIAWAAGDTHRWWWPAIIPGYAYWPEGVTRLATVEAFVEAFATLGYRPCADGDLERGIQKVALFASGGQVTHAARQLANGRWTSKLGRDIDIEHPLEGVVGPAYGDVVQFLCRNRPAV